jgi:hypothetical protein
VPSIILWLWPVWFRFHRLDAHLRQLTVYVDDTQSPLDLNPTEAMRRPRLLIGVLAEVEGTLI